MQQFVGNVTKDAVTKEVNGTTVIYLSIAENRRVKKDGKWVNEPAFIQCTLWDKAALAPHLVTGTLVTVTGNVRAEAYNGKAYLRIDHVVDIALPGGKPRSQNGNGSTGRNANTADTRTNQAQQAQAQDPDDLPF
jgi:single-strand DNA-binding protein